MMAGDLFGLKEALKTQINISNDKTENFLDFFKNLAHQILEFMLALAGILAVAGVVWAGFTFLTAYGNEEKVASAKKIMLYSLIGLAVSLSAFYILALLSQITK